MEVTNHKQWTRLITIVIVTAFFVGGTFTFLYINLQYQYRTLEQKYSSIDTKLDTLLQILESLQHDGGSGGLSAAEIYNLTKNSIAIIIVRTPSATKEGSGFIYDVFGQSGCYIVTNNHVVEGAENNEAQVTFYNGKTARGMIVGTDAYSDLAVLRVDASPESLLPLILGNSSALLVGQRVYAIGNPFGLSGSMTEGIISGLGRHLEAVGGYLIPDIIQIDAAINPGNSGGPLLNSLGLVVGVTTAIATETGTFSGVGFAISSNLVHRVAASLILNGTYQHPWLGVAGEDVTPEIAEELGLSETKGFVIRNVTAGSPADNAELKVNDVITEIDDREIRGIDDILTYLELYRNVGDTIKLTIIRTGVVLTKWLTLAARPSG